MQDLFGMLNTLSRPRLLIRAARIGARDYSRGRHLRRLLRCEALPRPGSALIQLLELERLQDDLRRAGDAGYSLTRHLDILIAMIGEARLLTPAEPVVTR